MNDQDKIRSSVTAPADLRRGDRIIVRALKATGKAYRWWPARVESIHPDRIVTVMHPGTRVSEIESRWSARYIVRTTYWYDRPYNLVESYEPDGRLRQLYIHIASPAWWYQGDLLYTDHELDVVMRPSEAPRVLDVKEFEQAAERYHYSPEFQAQAWEAVDEALDLIGSWAASSLRAPRANRHSR